MSIQSFITFPTESSAKRAADEDQVDHSAGSSKKPRVSIDAVPVLTEEPVSIEMDDKEAETTASPTPSIAVATSQPPPPRSPSPPRHRPTVPSPLSPVPSLSPPNDPPATIYSSSSPSISSPTPPPRRPRSHSTEIALLKFALDPWLRLSRALETSSAAAALKASCRPRAGTAFNPATYPSTGNLRELRVQACDPFYAPRGRSLTAPGAPVSFNFGEPTVKWSLVDA